MVDKRDSYTKEDLEASGRGELFGAGGPPLYNVRKTGE